MPTVQELLLSKYEEFKKDATTLIPDFEEKFEELDPNDLIDLMDLILFIFPDDKTARNLDDLLELKGLVMTQENKTLLIPIIDKYIVFLNKIKSLP